MKSFWIVSGLVVLLALMGIADSFGIPVFEMVGLTLIICIALAIAWFVPQSRWIIGVLVGLFLLGSAGIAIKEEWRFPFRFTSKQEVNLYPVPDPQKDPAAFEAWREEKVGIDPGEGAVGVLIKGWGWSLMAFFIFSGITWLVGKLGLMGSGVRIPVQVIFLLVWGAIVYYTLAVPIYSPGMDEASKQGVIFQFTLGFAKNFWYAALVTALSLGISTITQGTRKLGIHIVGLLVSGGSWLFAALFQTTLEPTIIAWTSCANLVGQTAISMSLCQEAYASGLVSALAVSMAWGWLMSLLDW